MDLGRAGFPQHPHDLARRCAAHDRVVHHDDTLAGDDLPHRVQLHLDAEVPDGLLRLNEGAPDVMVSDEAERERDAGLLGEPQSRVHAGVGHRHDDIG